MLAFIFATDESFDKRPGLHFDFQFLLRPLKFVPWVCINVTGQNPSLG